MWVTDLHAAATLYMVGVIWFVQLVHYPLFGRVGEAGFAAYAREHGWRATLVVVPPMLVELVTAAWLVWDPPQGAAATVRAGLALLLLIWGSTFLVQVPQHERLRNGFAADQHRLLVAANWVRTVAWTARGILAVSLAQQAR